MICDHPWISSSIVRHWGGYWIEYRCAYCGTGIERVKKEYPPITFFDYDAKLIEMNRRREYQREISKEIARLFRRSRNRNRVLIFTTPRPPDSRLKRILYRVSKKK